jgi:fimbrial chaperone protein
VIRVVREGTAPAIKDSTYRIVVDELPTPDQAPQTGVQFRLRFVVPVYVRATKATPAALQCQLVAAQLSCRNSGGRPAQLGATRLVDARGHEVPLTRGLFGYVLPASERRWSLDAASLSKLGGALRLESRVNGDPQTIAVGRAP